LLAGCARGAPDLPAAEPAATAPDAAARSCAELDQALAGTAQRIDSLEAPILANRQNNQISGYLGAFLLVPLIGLQSNESEKEALDAAQRERDQIIAQRAAHGCPPPRTNATGRVIGP
jgi:hypothetical protein